MFTRNVKEMLEIIGVDKKSYNVVVFKTTDKNKQLYMRKRGKMGWVLNSRYNAYVNDFRDFYFIVRENGSGKFYIYEYESYGENIEFDSLEELFAFDIEKYVEELRIKKREHYLEFMKANYNKKPSKTKRYYIYEIGSGLFLGRNARREWFLCDEPLQTFTKSQAFVLSGEFHGLYLFRWLLIEA